MGNPPSFVIVLLLPCSIASVLRTQTKDIFSVNDRLYDPDLYSSLYQETSRRKRLYVVPGLHKLDKQLHDDSFDIDELDNTKREDEISREPVQNDIKIKSNFLNMNDKTDDEDFFADSKPADETKQMTSRSFQSKSAENSNTWKDVLTRSSATPIARRYISKLTGRNRKRYKAGVVDRIAHGFGKRSLGSDGVSRAGDVSREAVRLNNELKEYLRIAKLLWTLNNRKGGNRNFFGHFTAEPTNRLYEDLVGDYLKNNGQVIDDEDDGNVLL